MDTVANLRAFLVTAKLGNFSEAARQLNVVPSVIAKRVAHLEWTLGTALFHRTTRTMELTVAGQKFQPRASALLGDFDSLVEDFGKESDALEGHLRVRAPTSLTVLYLGTIFARFKRLHPKVTMDVVLVDRSVNPIEEGFDIALGGLPSTYDGVHDEPLCQLKQILCATPAYLARAGTPAHPRDLHDHECLVFNPTGSTWLFDSVSGQVSVDVPTTLSSNDNHVLYSAVCEGNGIAILPTYIAAGALGKGELIGLMGGYPLHATWLKAQVPVRKMALRPIQVFLALLRESLSPLPPWEKDAAAATGA